MTAWIEVADGTPWSPDRPRFDVGVIAHALALTNRYGGHTRFPVSVGMHTLLCVSLAQELGMHEDVQREVLHHDDTEAFLGDMQSPWKRRLPDFVQLEAQLDAQLREHWKLPAETTAACKRIDLLALVIEAYHAMPNRGRNYDVPSDVREEGRKLIAGGFIVRPMDWRDVREAYLDTHAALFET